MDEELELLTPAIRVRQFGRGEVLIREGESGDRFYVLRQGKVDVLAMRVDGAAREHVRFIDDSSPENFFGETALLTERRAMQLKAYASYYNQVRTHLSLDKMDRIFAARRSWATSRQYQSSADSITNTSGFSFDEEQVR